jgi:hypothetical protein
MSAPLVEIPYFHSVCHAVLTPYLRVFGFESIQPGHDSVEHATTAAYLSDEVMMRFSYWPEDFPDYCLMVGAGFFDGSEYLENPEVGLWYAIPAEKRENWIFSDETELEKIVRHMRDEILPTYAEPLWKDPQLLRQLISRFHGERSANVEFMRVDRERYQAETAFRAGDYEKAIRIYTQLAPVDLTPTDLKRLAVARKKLL